MCNKHISTVIITSFYLINIRHIYRATEIIRITNIFWFIYIITSKKKTSPKVYGFLIKQRVEDHQRTDSQALGPEVASAAPPLPLGSSFMSLGFQTSSEFRITTKTSIAKTMELGHNFSV